MTDRLFGDRGFWRTTLRLALPIALQNLLTSSFILVDTLLVGQLGDIPLSAVGMAGQFGWFLNMVIFGICSGASVFISQYWGAKNIAGIHRVYGIAIVSLTAICALFMALGGFLPELVIKIFNRDPRVVAAGVAYLRIACWSYIAVGLSNIFAIALRSVEQVKLPMYVSALTTVLNAVMDYGLIFGRLGMPEMGVEGAALATVISSWAGPAVILIASGIKKNILIAPLKAIFGFSRYDVGTFFRKAVPVIMNETFWGLGTLLFSVIFGNMGYQYYAAVTIFRTFENFSFVFFIGLCSASSIMLGKGIGAGKVKRAVEDSVRFNIAAVIFSVFIGMLIIIFRRSLAGIFNTSGNITQTTLDLTASIMLVYALELPMRNIPYIQVVGTFRPGGDTATGMKLDLLSLWCCSVPLTAISAFVLDLPFVAVFAIMYISEDYLKVFMCLKHFFTYSWIRPVTPEGQKGLEEFWRDRQAKLEARRSSQHDQLS